jgi:hypothetical protein
MAYCALHKGTFDDRENCPYCKPVASPVTLSGETMPAISLWMPWANWVSLGWKTIETRTHKRFASLKGRRIGIHASLKWDDDALDLAGEFLSEAQRIQSRNFLRLGGGIICTAFVEDHRELDPLDNERALIDCTHVTRYGLILSDIRMLETIVPCKGKQGIFYVPVAVTLSEGQDTPPWDTSKDVRNGFICAEWEQRSEGPILDINTMRRRQVVVRCDRPDGHKGDHVDSVILVNWPQSNPAEGQETGK